METTTAPATHAPVILPRYLVEHKGTEFIIWDTVEHEETGFTFGTKEEASAKCKDINNRTPQ